MDLPHRCAGVRLGSAECGREEFDLFALQPRHIRTGEETGQFVVGEHAVVEVLDDGFECRGSADLLVNARHDVLQFSRFLSSAPWRRPRMALSDNNIEPTYPPG